MFNKSLPIVVLACLASAAHAACPAPPANLDIKAEFADPAKHRVYRDGIWAVWYHPSFFGVADARLVANRLKDVRCKSVAELGLKDPPNLANNTAVNIYVYDPRGGDGFENGWGNGVGTNIFDHPYMTLPAGAHEDIANLDHEGFHIFQYASDAPGYEYSGDSGWFIEATAEWYAVQRQPQMAGAYATAGAIAGNPHLALWHGFDNAKAGDPVHWMTETRQYGLHLYLNHLTTVAGLPARAITGGFYAGTRKLPQAYLAEAMGHVDKAAAYADFAAYLTASFADGSNGPMPAWIMTQAQRDYAVAERATMIADEPMRGIVNDIAATIDFSEQRGVWVSPPSRLQPRPWAHNVIKLDGARDRAQLTLDSPDADSLQMRVAMLRGQRWQIAPVQSGDILNLAGADLAYLVIAATPAVYQGATRHPYRVRLD